MSEEYNPMDLISLDEIRAYLKIMNKKYHDEDYTDESLEILVKVVLSEIQAITGLSFYPHTCQQEVSKAYKHINLNSYPVVKINRIYNHNNTDLTNSVDYLLDNDAGIIHLKRHVCNTLIFEYIHQYSKEDFIMYIIPLLMDYLLIKMYPDIYGIASMKVGETSISYNTKTSIGYRVNEQLNRLSRSRKCRGVMIW